ncbi:exodeoxyribonuclease VII small subunit [Williamsia herbipolensis]|uniref:exodeoxyribonuclease VII small subunit n=1 Tax=Williamsia herbipolensis TaxID=1603258 RepID=UPI0005F88C1C|nr:exodeoxyribonuclease VII small subunit [Williamsia herbipolensis]
MATRKPDAATDGSTGGSDAEESIESLGYEQARDELIGVVRTLEQGGLDLDASLTLWERGEALARRCEEHLEGARERIETALGDVDADDADGDLADDDDLDD